MEKKKPRRFPCIAAVVQASGTPGSALGAGLGPAVSTPCRDPLFRRLAVTATSRDILPSMSESVRRKITRRLIPFLFCCYIAAYVDRVNVGFAGLDMTKDLHFSNEVFGFGSGIFFFGYCLLEIPGALLAEVW